jgi:hypothetical protein
MQERLIKPDVGPVVVALDSSVESFDYVMVVYPELSLILLHLSSLLVVVVEKLFCLRDFPF